MIQNHFDLIIIGAGPGGYETAAYANGKGLKTLLIEKAEIGGTCLHRGCIPTKTLLHASHLYNEIKSANYYGISCENVTVDWPKVIQRKDRLVKRLTKGIEETLKNVTVLKAQACLSDNCTVQADGQYFTADNIIVATGTTPATIGNIPVDNQFIHTTDTIMNLTQLPQSLAIIGGGVIGVEFAEIYAGLGVKVTVIELAADILINLDQDAREILKKELKSKKVDLLTATAVEQIDPKTKTLTLSNSVQLVADQVLLSIGRKANLAGLELLDTTAKGYVQVDNHLQTNLPRVFAIGDVNGLSLYAHSATYQGIKVVDYLTTGKWNFDNKMPAVIFTQPQVAVIGQTSGSCLQKNLMQVGRYQIDNDSKGFVKIFYDQNQQIVGVVIVANKAEALIGEAVALVGQKTTVEKLKNIVHPHPSLSEAFSFF